MKHLATFIYAILITFLSNSIYAAPSSWGKEDKMSSVEEKINAKDYQSAINELTTMVESDSKNADAFNLLGYSNRKLKRYEVAEKFYQKALELNPKHKGAMEYLGELYVETNRLDEANQMLARLDKACYFTCEEFKLLKAAIDRKSQGLEHSSNW